MFINNIHRSSVYVKFLLVTIDQVKTIRILIINSVGSKQSMS